jgi:tetratricopeptide (TPR) repeat protein
VLTAIYLVLLLAAPGSQAEQYRRAGLDFSSRRNWDLAIENYRKAVALEPGDADTHYNLALALKYKGDSRQAADEFQSAIALKPKWADAHYGLGAAWYDLHDRAAAMKEMHAAVALDPGNAGAHRYLGRGIPRRSQAESTIRRGVRPAGRDPPPPGRPGGGDSRVSQSH